MINKINLVKNIGSFEENTEIAFVMDKMNIFYGLNATGKTTLTRLLKANSEMIVQEEKDRLNKLIKTYGEEAPIKYEINSENKNYIKVFDNEYVTEKIGKKSFDLNKFEVENVIDENFKNPLEDEYLRFKDIVEKNEITNKDIRDNLNKSIIDEFDLIKKDVNMTRKFNDELNKRIFDEFRKQNTINTDKKIEILKKYTAISKVSFEDKILDFNVDENELKAILIEVKEILKFNEEIVDNKYIEEVLDITNQEKKKWILEGIKHIKVEDGCPFCKSKQNIELLTEYKKYEQSRIKEISQKNEMLKNKIEEFVNNSIDKKSMLLKKITYNKDIIDDFDKLENEINNLYGNIQAIYEELKEIIDNKYENINMDCTETYKKEVDIWYKDFEQEIKYIKQKIDDFNSVIDKSTKEQDGLRKEYVDSVIIPYIANKYKDTYLDLEKKEIELKENKRRRDEAFVKFKKDLEEKNILIKTVNNNLKLLNIEKYTVNSKFQLELKNKNINNEYRNFLSEGEKTSIALALFISELETSKESDKVNILVFDDPISSFDYDNIYNIYYIIKDKWKELNNNVQFIILTHNNVFYNCLKYSSEICNFQKLVKTTNGKTIVEKDKLIKSIYMEKLRCINTIKNSEHISVEQKLYIPNFCRYIFETQANFLYPNVEDSMKSYTNEIILKNSEIQINKIKLDSYLGMCNTGSHSQVTEMLDGEDVTNYKQLCDVCIRITKYFFKEQINNI